MRLIFGKAHVRSYARHGPSGQMVAVRGYDAARERTHAPTREERDGVARAAEGRPTVQAFLDRVTKISPRLAAAAEGIWSGRDGTVREEIPGTGRLLVVGWHNGRVEYAYIS